jgi:hypothetical protein
VRIGLWGPSGSGKTTFLAALKVATTRNQLPGNWIMNGSDDESADFLINLTDQLVRDRRFPQGTDLPTGYVFRFTGEGPMVRRRQESASGAARGGRMARMLRPMGERQPTQDAFELDVLDVPGGLYKGTRAGDLSEDLGESEELSFGDEPAENGLGGGNDALFGPPDDEERLLDHLQECQGILYLYDPVQDARDGDSFDSFHRILEKLTRRVFEQDGYNRPKLPHHVAVCVTKFDQPEIYKLARRYGHTVQDQAPPFLPRVSNARAAEFFHRLCVESASNADMVDAGIRQYFNTVSYFVTSAIGFYVGNGRRFQPHNHLNLEAGPGGVRIKGRVYPINVLEPVLWLHNSLQSAR